MIKLLIIMDKNNTLFKDVSIKCYVNGRGENSVNIYFNHTIIAKWSDDSNTFLYPTITYSNTSTTMTITLTATFSTTTFLVIRYCPGLTTITVS